MPGNVGIGVGICNGGSVWTPARVSGLNTRFDDVTGLYTDTGGTTACVNDGDSVARWNNPVNSINLQQATAGLRPLYRTAGGVALNGYPIVQFDGTDDNLRTGSYTLAQPLTIFAVIKSRVWVSADRILDGIGADRAVFTQYSAGSQYSLYAGTAFACANDPGATNVWHIVCLRFNGASSSIKINAGSAVTGDPGSTGLTDGRTIGSHWNGTAAAAVDIASLWEYGANVSSTDETDIRNWLNAKYAVF